MFLRHSIALFCTVRQRKRPQRTSLWCKIVLVGIGPQSTNRHMYHLHIADRWRIVYWHKRRQHTYRIYSTYRRYSRCCNNCLRHMSL